jgi:hypothetical protein
MKTESRTLLFVIVALLTPAGAAAQQPGVPVVPSGTPKDRLIEDKMRSAEIERVRRAADKPDPAPEPRRFPEIKEDFEKIQLINNEVLQARPASGAPDPDRIRQAAAEVAKRARRLQSNIFPPEREKRGAARRQEPEEPKELAEILAALDAAIASFVHNPTFTNLKVVDATDSANARRDLAEIIRLSALLEKRAEEIKKTGGD